MHFINEMLKERLEGRGKVQRLLSKMYVMDDSILIVEDDKDIREVLTTYLEIKGFEVKGTEDVTVSELSPKPDLILLDVALGGKSGKDICREVKQNPVTANIPVIMMSANSGAYASCMQAGANSFISKPFEFTLLINTIKSLLQSGRNRTSSFA